VVSMGFVITLRNGEGGDHDGLGPVVGRGGRAAAGTPSAGAPDLANLSTMRKPRLLPRRC
jgi:hypothetical protein